MARRAPSRRPPEALALDFDGVISDSARECLAVARATYVGLHPASPLARRGEDALREGFLALMPLGNRAEDFGVALRILDTGARVESQEGYDAFRDALDPAWLEAFHVRFYREREAWSRRDPAGWRRLMAPYAGFVAILRRAPASLVLAIATAKDRRSVRILLRDYGLDDLFPESRVLDKETGRSKVAHLRTLRERLGIPFEAITFVDDKLNHLDAVAPLGVRCVLAAWGYNGERERRGARERGHEVCTLDDFADRVFP
jgi:phosphoglycolate phosphatase-like HAD superfamily hydrolase